ERDFELGSFEIGCRCPVTGNWQLATMWNPEHYNQFKNERAQPFWDLVSLIDPRPHMRIADLGCGTGELTRALHEELQARETIGIDDSSSMLAKAPSAPGLQ